MLKRASIDIGSNSVLLLVLENKNGQWHELAKESFVTGLGRGLDKTGLFSEEAMKETWEALGAYQKMVKSFGIEPQAVLCTATEAARVARNSKEYFEKIFTELGLQIKIITSDAEALLSAKGILFDQSIKDEFFTVMDIGGASTELIRIQQEPFAIIKTISLPIGAVRATDWLQQGILKEKFAEAHQKFSSDFRTFSDEKLFCVAGTMTSVANMLLEKKTFVEDEVNGFEFNLKKLNQLFEQNDGLTPEVFLEKYPFLGKRAKSILGGLYVAKEVCSWVEPKKLYVSTYGLRYGVALAGEIAPKFLN